MGALASLRYGLRRLKIRRLYNHSKFRESIRFAEAQLNCPINGQFAKDIIIRALWNLEEWSLAIDFVMQHPQIDTSNYLQRAKYKLNQGHLEILPPAELRSTEWNGVELLQNWYQVGMVLWLRYPNGWLHWEMPIEFDLSSTHPSLLALAMETVLYPMVSETAHIKTKPRSRGSKKALAFSGGVDSTAAAILLPNDTILSYHRRNFPSMLNHGLAERQFPVWEKSFNRKILQIPSNHELLRTNLGKNIGFSTDFAAGVHLILLADLLDLGTIGFGTPLDNTWLSKGRTYRKFSESKYWEKWKSSFLHSGLNLEFPINHISEAGALIICENSGFIDSINSCLRGNSIEGCGRCWKCFHKNGPLGRKVVFESKEIQTFISTIPLRTGQHALWAIKKQGLENKVPHLSEFLTESLDWWERFYPFGLELIGPEWKFSVEKETKKYLESMEEPFHLESVDLF